MIWNIIIMRMGKRLFTAALLFAAASAAATAQELYGGQALGRPQYELPGAMQGVKTPNFLRDSLTFVRRMKDSLWMAPVVRQWSMPARMPVEATQLGRMSAVVQAGGGLPLTYYPYSSDYRTGGVITSWRGGAMFGSGAHVSMPGLMSVQNATLGVTQTFGNLIMTATVSADRSSLWSTGPGMGRGGGGMRTLTRGTYYTFGGAMTYRFNDNISATVFGRYSTNRSFYSMGAMPYLGTSGYGGFLTFMGETVGMDLGVERYYDTFAQRWVTSPIVTPKIRFSEKFVLELPVGPLVKDLIDNAVHNNKRRSGPMIMPEGLPSVAPIPFGPPEMPR